MALSKNRSMKFTSNGFTDSTPKLILQDNSTITIEIQWYCAIAHKFNAAKKAAPSLNESNLFLPMKK